jgi:hypothetical protein
MISEMWKLLSESVGVVNHDLLRYPFMIKQNAIFVLFLRKCFKFMFFSFLPQCKKAFSSAWLIEMSIENTFPWKSSNCRFNHLISIFLIIVCHYINFWIFHWETRLGNCWKVIQMIKFHIISNYSRFYRKLSSFFQC